MENRNTNNSLHKAKISKTDEFYTQISDIEKELKHYRHHFKDKVVFCNCDDPRVSNFFLYFSLNFEKLGLKKLITTCYKNQNAELFSSHDCEKAIYLEYTSDKNSKSLESEIKYLEGDGDFRSPECINLLNESDIVVTNPPFSLFREYVIQLFEHNKKFIIIGNFNMISYKEIFSLIREDKLWLGYTHPVQFIVPDHYEIRENRSWRDENGINWRSLGNACWFTNLDIKKRHEDLILYKRYDPVQYPIYDNYDAINVDKSSDIPCDFQGCMGVPITFLDKYNPEQFEIIALGIVGSIDFTCNKKMEILDKNGLPTGKMTYNAKGTLYRLYNPKTDRKPAFRNSETGELYRSIYARVIIKNKRI
mgnify:CR=1 FL=1